jgi:hypothetical protein
MISCYSNKQNERNCVLLISPFSYVDRDMHLCDFDHAADA